MSDLNEAYNREKFSRSVNFDDFRAGYEAARRAPAAAPAPVAASDDTDYWLRHYAERITREADQHSDEFADIMQDIAEEMMGEQVPPAAPIVQPVGDERDSIALCCADMDQSARIDSPREMQAVLRAVSKRLKALAAPTTAAADAKDAARYRFLRNPQTNVNGIIDKRTGWIEYDEGTGTGGYGIYEFRAGEELDAAIDAAITTSADEGAKNA